MRLYKINNDTNIKQALDLLGVDQGGRAILESKMQYHLIKIESLHVGAANILKQDALSVGADLAVPRGTIVCEEPYVDAILMATSKQLKQLSKKELSQPFGLKALAKSLDAILKAYKDDAIEIMGIINANEDSFYEQSRFQGTQALAMIEKMIQEGASIIDLGGVSSRPGSLGISADEEMQRVKSIIDLIHSESLYEQAVFSIDSYRPNVIEYALERGFTIVNDITGLADDDVCRIAAKHKAKVVIMHMQGTPHTMQNDPSYDNVITEVTDFFYERIEKAKAFGIDEIILDVGIGFGKSLEDNLRVLKHLSHFRSLGYPLLVGASRKSLIDKIMPTPIQERLPATLALHLEALRAGANIIRCHDVKEHHQAFSIEKALRNIL